MTSSLSAVSLDFPLQPSRWLSWYRCAIHAVPVVLAVILPLPAWAAMVLIVVAIAVAYVDFRQRGGQTVTQLQWRATGWRLLGPGLDGDAQLQRFWLRPWGMMLHFVIDGTGARRVLIARDQLDSQSYRRLRVMIIHGGVELPVPDGG